MKKQKPYPCKIGTQPWVVVLWRSYRLEVGRKIKVRDYRHGSKWFCVTIERVNGDGYFFATL